MKREPGYYWVKYEGQWRIALWWEYMTDKFEWDLFDRIHEDSDFEEIDERRIERGEHIENYWKPN